MRKDWNRAKCTNMEYVHSAYQETFKKEDAKLKVWSNINKKVHSILYMQTNKYVYVLKGLEGYTSKCK